MLTRSRGGILKTMLWLLAAVSLAIAALVGVNFWDEDLSPAAREAMKLPEPPPASERNGYVHFLAMGATGRESSYSAGLKVLAALRKQNTPGVKNPPEADDTLTLQNIKVDAAVPKCMPEEKSCLEAAASSTDLDQVIALHSDRLERYRAMRELPEFVDLYYPTSESAPLPAYQGLLRAQQLSLLKAAVAANAGRHAEALQEMEAETTFHRRMAAGSGLMITRFIAAAMQERDLLFISELARATGRAPPAGYLKRLAAMASAPPAAELDLRRMARNELAFVANLMSKRSSGRPDVFYLIADKKVPWWNFAMPLFYRPNETVNRHVAQTFLLLQVADVPATAFRKAAEDAARRARELLPQGPMALLVNPVGRDTLWLRDLNESVAPYVARMHTLRGLYSLVSLQIALRDSGALTPDAVEAALAGPLGAAHPDPYSGLPMRFDPRNATIGFESDSQRGSVIERLKKRYGRVAVPIV